jgi:mono/diheme cytochrome c family protein
MKRALILSFLPLLAFAADNKTNKPAPTFNKDIAPIFFDRCVSCHRDGNVAPMSLMSYTETRPWIKSIREKVLAHAMPPWTADPAYGHFLNDRELTQAQIDTIKTWVDTGAKEGSPEDLPPTPQFPKGWNIGQPDQVFEMAEEYTVPAEGVVDYQHFQVPTNFKEDRWIRGAEIRNVDSSVVHHVIVFIQPPATDRPKPFGIVPGAEWRTEKRDKPAEIKGTKLSRERLGYFLTATGPGERGTVFPTGSGMRIPAGSNLIFQIHYTPKGTAVKDRAKIGLFYLNQPPENEIRTIGVQNGQFVIPAGEANHRVDSTVTFAEDARVWGLIPHMHLRGKSFEYRLITPDGKSRVILSVPKYDFNWQMVYSLAEPLVIPKGSRLECTAYFDNSKTNKYNPDATKDVKWGDQTWEEMMIGFMTYSLDSQKIKPASAGGGQ